MSLRYKCLFFLGLVSGVLSSGTSGAISFENGGCFRALNSVMGSGDFAYLYRDYPLEYDRRSMVTVSKHERKNSDGSYQVVDFRFVKKLQIDRPVWNEDESRAESWTNWDTVPDPFVGGQLQISFTKLDTANDYYGPIFNFEEKVANGEKKLIFNPSKIGNGASVFAFSWMWISVLYPEVKKTARERLSGEFLQILRERKDVPTFFEGNPSVLNLIRSGSSPSEIEAALAFKAVEKVAEILKPNRDYREYLKLFSKEGNMPLAYARMYSAKTLDFFAEGEIKKIMSGLPMQQINKAETAQLKRKVVEKARAVLASHRDRLLKAMFLDCALLFPRWNARMSEDSFERLQLWVVLNHLGLSSEILPIKLP